MQAQGRAVLFFSLLLLLAAPLLSSRDAGNTGPGWVATVNGEPITFDEAEAKRISTFSPRTPDAAPLNELTLQEQYRYAVSRLVEERIICQFMQQKGFALDPAVLEAEETRIRADYPDNQAFAAMFLEEGIRQEVWREALRTRLIITHFINHELRPEISISAPEVEKYYLEHNRDFILPEQWHFLQISGPDQNEVEKAQAAVVENRDAAAARKEHSVAIHEINMARHRLPEELQKELEGLEPWQGSAATAHEGQFRNFVLIEKVPERRLDTASISRRVEQALTEKKLKGIYAEWLNNNLAANRISLAPSLFRPIAPGSPSASPFPVLKKPSLPMPMLDIEPSEDAMP